MMRIVAVVVLVVLLLTGATAGAESIRVGYLGPLSGIFAAAGKDMLDGLKMAFEQVNYEVAGRKIELIEEDDEGNPCLLYTSPSPRDRQKSRMPSSA